MKSILIVEDNEMNRDMLQRRLRRLSHEVRACKNGKEAINLVESDYTPEVIIMDLSMPVMDGWEATKIIRNGSAWEELPIIALSANASSGDKERAIDVGCSFYLTKPIEMDKLEGIINMEHKKVA